MMKYISIGMILVGVAVFFVIVMLSSNDFSWFQLIVSLACIVIALALSFVAIRQIGRGDEEARRRYPAWDQAMANWARLLYCTRDRVVFDPQSRKTLSDDAVRSQLDMDRLEGESREAQLAVSH